MRVPFSNVHLIPSDIVLQAVAYGKEVSIEAKYPNTIPFLTGMYDGRIFGYCISRNFSAEWVRAISDEAQDIAEAREKEKELKEKGL